jgi:hypothetical protein
LETSTRKPRANARRTGPADPNEILTVSVSVRVRPDAPPLPTPEKMAAAPRGGKRYITREDYTAHYGASQTDLDKIAQFGAAQGRWRRSPEQAWLARDEVRNRAVDGYVGCRFRGDNRRIECLAGGGQ